MSLRLQIPHKSLDQSFFGDGRHTGADLLLGQSHGELGGIAFQSHAGGLAGGSDFLFGLRLDLGDFPLGLLRQALEDPTLTAGERVFLTVLRPALEEQAGGGDERVFVGGAATLLDAVRGSELDACRSLLSVLERRAATLELLRASIEQRRPYVRVGEELDNPALSGVSLVGARYGLAHRTLGTISLLGPTRMDYEKAIGAVRAAAQELSRFVEEVYEE